MKGALILLACMWLTGCVNQGALVSAESSLAVDKEVHPMTRTEVIDAITECQTAGMRAVVVNSRRKINNYSTPTVVDVTCAPKYGF